MATSFQHLKNAVISLKSFFGDFFTSKECPAYWLIALLVNISLIVGASELLKTPSSFSTSVDDNVTLNASSTTDRVVLFIVDELTPKSFFTSVTNGSVLRSVMERAGLWGVVTSQENYGDDVTLKMLLTGSDWRGSAMPTSAEYWYIGEESRLSALKSLNENVKWNGMTHKADLGSNLTWATIPQDLSDWIYTNSLTVFKKLRMKDHKTKKAVILVQFTGVRMAKSMEGDNTRLMDDTIKSVIGAIESLVHMSKDLRTAYCLISNSKESPMLLWGSGVGTSRPPGKDAHQPVEWKTPSTKRRDLDRRQIAALVFCLLGIPPPRDSYGAVPVDVLKDNALLRADCAVNSAFQLMRLFKDVLAKKKASGRAKLTSLWTPTPEKSIDSLASQLPHLNGYDYHEVIAKAKLLAEKCQQGIEFYVNFNRNVIWLLILFTNIGWVLCAFTWICPPSNPIQPNERNEGRHSCGCSGFGIIFSRHLFFNILYVGVVGSIFAILTFEEVSYRVYYLLTCASVVWWCFFNGVNKIGGFYSGPRAHFADGDPASKVLSLLYGVLTFVDWLFAGEPIALVVLLVISLSFSTFFFEVRSKNPLLSLWLLSSMPLITAVIEQVHLEANLSPFLMSLAWILTASFFAYLLKVTQVDLPILIASVSTLCALAWRSRQGRQSEYMFFLSWLGVVFVPVFGSKRFCVRLLQVLLSLSVTLFRPTVATGDQMKILFLLIHAAAWLLFEAYESTQDFVIAAITRDKSSPNPPPNRQPRPSSRQILLHDVRRSSFFLLYCFIVVPVKPLTSKITTWQKELEADLNQTVFRHGLNYILQVFVPILGLTILFDHMNRTSNRNQSKTIALAMFFYSFMTLVYIISAYGSSPIQMASNVSYLIQPLIMCISFLVALPLCYAFTLPSTLSIQTLK